MELLIRRAEERGHENHGWLDTFHTFSFADFYDEAWMGFKTLRVINEDRIAGGGAFGMHGHRDMEILTYVISGALRHSDTMGNIEVIQAGDIQCMSAGTGVMHSEENNSETEECHLYQIWIQPSRSGLQPSYDQKTLPPIPQKGTGIQNPGTLIASPDGREDSLLINQDAEVRLWRLEAGEKIVVPEQAGNQKACWFQVVLGDIEISPVLPSEVESKRVPSILRSSDAAAFDASLEFKAVSKAAVMLFVV
jgi:redox-sensitive bicupin YhaK (pirin superfamily)